MIIEIQVLSCYVDPIKASGLGKLKPNILVMGFKANWKECSPCNLDDYINAI